MNDCVNFCSLKKWLLSFIKKLYGKSKPGVQKVWSSKFKMCQKRDSRCEFDESDVNAALRIFNF